MTDNRTTELREKLRERGVKMFHSGPNVTYFETPYGEAQATEYEPGVFGVMMKGLTTDQAIAATLGSEREAKLIRAMEDVLRHATGTVWVSEIETLVDRMVSLGVYGCEVYEGARPWEVD